jgi:amidase
MKNMADHKSATELCRLSAADAVAALHKGEVSPLELVEASAARIEATDSALNALPTLCIDRARAHAKKIMSKSGARRGDPAWLGGLPISVKDLVAVAGVRTTWGSPLFADHVPARSDILVERLEANGAIVMGKSNTPEFGAGASTFNEVFGKTRNPWNTDKSCGGSSGGAAVSLAAGQVWMATGSDLGGSLRIPASYCSITGLRPSPGRVPHGPADLSFDTLIVDGPMARDALDTALFLDAMCGAHLEDPITLAAPALPFAKAVREKDKHRPRRVAYSADLGLFPVDREVAEICAATARRFTAIGARVEDGGPSFKGAVETFQTLRAALFSAMKGDLLRTRRDALKPELIWNIEKGMALQSDEIGRAEIARTKLYHRMAKFFGDHDLLLCPTVIVPPFDVDTRYIEEVNGHKFDNYVDWLGMTFVLSLTGCPAVSTPAGFTRDGLPVGLQIIGPPHSEARVLAAAALLEEELDLAPSVPIAPKTPAR